MKRLNETLCGLSDEIRMILGTSAENGHSLEHGQARGRKAEQVDHVRVN